MKFFILISFLLLTACSDADHLMADAYSGQTTRIINPSCISEALSQLPEIGYVKPSPQLHQNGTVTTYTYSIDAAELNPIVQHSFVVNVISDAHKTVIMQIIETHASAGAEVIQAALPIAHKMQDAVIKTCALPPHFFQKHTI